MLRVPRRGYSLDERAEILDFPARLAHYRRYSDPRYYKGVEYVDIAEALARRRCAELFATRPFRRRYFCQCPTLSGAPANNAVYHALINPGDTIWAWIYCTASPFAWFTGQPVRKTVSRIALHHRSADRADQLRSD